MILGFTGTGSSKEPGKGMTQRQHATVRYLFLELQLHVLHHGDCIGSDAQAHRLARELHARIVIHPPDNPKARAFCLDADQLLEPKPFLVRDREIVAAGIDGLIATPKDFVKPASLRGQGTWTTIGYAQQAKRYIWYVWPDGTFKEETGVRIGQIAL